METQAPPHPFVRMNRSTQVCAVDYSLNGTMLMSVLDMYVHTISSISHKFIHVPGLVLFFVPWGGCEERVGYRWQDNESL